MNLLLLRGLGRERRHWHDFPERLADGGVRTLALLDLPGAGTETRRLPCPSVAWMARDVARRWRSSAGGPQRDWTVVGLSLGGMVALELCRQLPERVGRAIIINSSSRLTPMVSRLRPEAALDLLQVAFTHDPAERERRVLQLTSTLAPEQLGTLAERAAELAREAPGSRRALALQLAAAARFLPPEPRLLSAQLLFVCSRRDALVSPRASHDLAALYQGRIEEHPDAGHDLPLDAPEWLCERVLSFARGTLAP